MKRILFLLPLLAFFLLALALAVALYSGHKNSISPLLQKPLPSFMLPSIFANEPTLHNGVFKGQMALINIFASWCAGCRVEHPLLLQLAKSNHVALYGINWKDKDAAATAWLEEMGNPYTAVGADKAGRAAIELGITGAPETFLVNREGIIIFHFAGPLTESIVEREIIPLLSD